MTEQKVQKPDFVTNKHLVYLDKLRESGVTNMYGACPYLRKQFLSFNDNQARECLTYWMRTFSQRHVNV